jgi:hypothetical protein
LKFTTLILQVLGRVQQIQKSSDDSPKPTKLKQDIIQRLKNESGSHHKDRRVLVGLLTSWKLSILNFVFLGEQSFCEKAAVGHGSHEHTRGTNGLSHQTNIGIHTTAQSGFVGRPAGGKLRINHLWKLQNVDRYSDPIHIRRVRPVRPYRPVS